MILYDKKLLPFFLLLQTGRFLQLGNILDAKLSMKVYLAKFLNYILMEDREPEVNENWCMHACVLLLCICAD